MSTGLLTDLYQITMAAGYFATGKGRERACFEMFFRRLPRYRNYVIAAGLEQAVEYLLNLRFTREEVGYLRGLPQLKHIPGEFFDSLLAFRFTGDVFAVAEGTPVFPEEPLMTIYAPLIEAQIIETYLLSMIGFQSLVATKASRIVESAGGRDVVEFGARRAHSPEAGVLAGRAAFVGGCAGTSSVAAGYRFGLPVFGTAAHSWVLSFENERQAFRKLQELLGEQTVYLIDTFDTVEGARIAGSLGRPLWGVRLDSGNLLELARTVRGILDDAGLHEARIMATSDLNEYRILEFTAAGAPIDVYGVGTDLATSADSPSMGVVYKLVELEEDGHKRYTAKFSEDKHTLPGAKQVFRFARHDVIACANECMGCHEPEPPVALSRPVVIHGEPAEPVPNAFAARENTLASVRKLPSTVRSLFDTLDPWRVEYSADLQSLYERVRGVHREP